MDGARLIQIGIRGPVYGRDDFDFHAEHGLEVIRIGDVKEHGVARALERVARLRGRPGLLLLRHRRRGSGVSRRRRARPRSAGSPATRRWASCAASGASTWSAPTSSRWRRRTTGPARSRASSPPICSSSCWACSRSASASTLGGGLCPPSDASPRTADRAGEASARSGNARRSQAGPGFPTLRPSGPPRGLVNRSGIAGRARERRAARARVLSSPRGVPMRRGHSAVLAVLAALAVLAVGLPAAPGGAAGVPDRARRRHHPDHRAAPRHRHRAARATERAQALVVMLNTPGGLERSMRSMVQRILNADIPVIVYVGPTGARAASAGVFITMAGHVAAMAPATNIGAAHPVAAGGGQMDKEMQQEGGERRRGLRALDRHRARPQRRVGGEGGALVGVGDRARGSEAQGGGPGGRQRARSAGPRSTAAW